jgi:uncharacterized protein (TIGR03083 family)
MTSLVPLVDRTIAALRTEYDTLAGLVADLNADQLTGPSAAARWSLAHVLSHLGSGSEITLAELRGTLGTGEQPGEGFNQSVWDRWNALSPVEQRDGFLERAGELTAAFEALDDEQRTSLLLTVGYLPAPMPIVAYAGLRLGELSLHSWDVRVALAPHAELAEETAAVQAELLAGPTGFMLGFIGKSNEVAVPVAMDIVGSGYGVAIGDRVSLLRAPDAPTATFAGPLESALRLFAGRLAPEYTPEGLRVTGNVTLDQLRTVFPGY